jgi:succinate-semialdehyde dehydrogenase/glutarate-semialdehyde dehydrogenase
MTYRSINPYTEDVVARYESHTDAQLDTLLQRADQAFRDDWRHRSYADRAVVMTRAADLLEQRKDALARLATSEMGKRLAEARFEVGFCVEILRHYASYAERFLAPRHLEVDGRPARVEARPLGTIFCIEPWNFPFVQLARVAAPNLMAGNTVMMKPAPGVPGCALAFETVFLDAGAPPGVYTNVFLSDRQAANAIADRRIHGVSLTGSERAGTAVGAVAGMALKKATMELGGSDAFLVLEDADLDRAVELAVFGRMMNTGQACAGSKRFIVHARLYDAFVGRFAEVLEGFVAGDPMLDETTLGPLVSASALSRALGQIKEAVAKGATVVTGGKRISRRGFFLEPTILADVATDNPAFREEFFAPVAMVFKVQTDDEAVDLANDSPYGLACAVVSTDLHRAERVAGRLECGMVFINQIAESTPELPWGGVKNSGYGRELSQLGIAEFVNWKLTRNGLPVARQE